MEHVANPHSVTILIKGPSDHVIAQIKDAVRDGLRCARRALTGMAWGLRLGAGYEPRGRTREHAL